MGDLLPLFLLWIVVVSIAAVVWMTLRRFLADKPVIALELLPPEEKQLVFKRTGGTMCGPDGGPLTVAQYRALIDAETADQDAMYACVLAQTRTARAQHEALLAELRTKIMHQKIRDLDHEHN